MTASPYTDVALIDADKWLDAQISKALHSLRKRPQNNRGPYVITDAMLDRMENKK